MKHPIASQPSSLSSWLYFASALLLGTGFLVLLNGIGKTAFNSILVRAEQNLSSVQPIALASSGNRHRIAASAPFTITGRVTDEGGRPFAAVHILATNGYSATSQVDGYYRFSLLEAGTYNLTPNLPGFVFQPATRTVTLPPSFANQDFTILATASTFLPAILSAIPNLPPHTPSTPVPADGSDDQSVDVDLAWVGGDPDGEPVTYDVYLEAGDATPDVLVSDNQTTTSLDPGPLADGAHYYWQVIAVDEHGATTNGPIWEFWTETSAPTGWLGSVNHYRAGIGLPPVTENPTWSNGCWLHARYMVKNDEVTHTENPANPWYDPEGQVAAQASNIIVSGSDRTTDEFAIDFWMRGPFHALGIIDPKLEQVGFGSYREAVGMYHMGAALDVSRGRGSIPASVAFPIQWPADGSIVSITSNANEYPDPLSSCPGYTSPSGLPIVLQIGSGDLVPAVSDHSLRMGATHLEHCVFDETSYTSSNASEQSTGRLILAVRDAIVLVPKDPLQPGKSYTVSITTNGQTHSWSFSVSGSAASAVHHVYPWIR